MRLHHHKLAILLLTYSYCNSQESKSNINFPFLDSITKVRLSDKTEVREHIGCFVEHSTVGEMELKKFLNDTAVSTEKKSKLLELVLLNNTLYHLHRLAGKAIQSDDGLKLSFRNNVISDYLKLRTTITIEDDVFYSGGDFRELKPEKVKEILAIIDNPESNDVSKKYFIEVLYSLTSKAETGNLLVSRIGELNINDSLKQYNRQLFKIFELNKPIYERLNAIKTWKEMDKNKDQLENLFKVKHPIIFFQILSQNPSTVLKSKKLSTLKNDAILSIIQNSAPTSFFNDLRIFYLFQFLIEGNYSIRFIDTIMTEKERKQYVNQLETE